MNLKKLVADKYPIIMHRTSEAVSFGASRFAYGVAHKEDTEEEAKTKEKEIETGTNNAIISQSIPSTYIIDNITSKSITITTAKVTKSNINNKDKDKDKDNKEEDNKEINNDSKKYPTE